ncbi:MAG TPA: TonB-dependent receptor [Ignavibacteriaceae bacterium]|nr:TonB-dependent receptor [Ignavibacteriaceae bacterium]
MKKIVFLVLLFSIIALGQDSNNMQRGNGGPMFSDGMVKGILLDSLTQKPIEYGTISLFSKRDSTVSTGAVSISDGTFSIDKVKAGIYYAQITFIGYSKLVIDTIRIGPRNPQIDLGKIYLKSTSLTLDNVTVTGQRDFITNTIDKKVIDVSKLILSSGGNALDVLQNVPSINVDVDGNVSLRGNQNLKILVDGKESGLATMEPSDLLQSLSANAIDRIELITNPSSKYNPEGTAGILNIILKRKAELGINANVSANAGTGDKYNASGDINLRSSFFNLSAGYDKRLMNMNSSGTSVRNNTFGLYRYIDQISDNNNNHDGDNGRISLDLMPDELNIFTVGFDYHGRSFGSDGTTANTYLGEGNTLLRDYLRTSSQDRGMNSYDYNFGYKHIFDRDHTIQLDAAIENDKSNGETNIFQKEMSTSFNQLNKSLNNNKEYDIKLDYSYLLNKDNKIEAGLRSRIRDMNSENLYLLKDSITGNFADYEPPYYFDYKEQIHAGYITYGNALGKLTYQLGVRGEMVTTEPIVKGLSGDYKNNYTSLYPSAFLMYAFSENDEMTLNYSRRVDRPNSRLLNPYVDYTDSTNISSGNPFLKPQYINSMEAGYTKYLGSTSFNTNVFYRHTSGLISAITEINQQGFTKTTYGNISSGNYYGGELSIMYPMFQWFRTNLSFLYFVNDFKDPSTNVKINNDSWSAKLNSTLILPYQFQVQLMFNYQAPTIAASMGGRGGHGPGGGGGGFGMGGGSAIQTSIKEMYGLDLAVKKDFLDNKLSLILRVSDVFNTRKFDSNTIGDGYIMQNARRFDSRVAFLGISYRFSSNGERPQREKQREEDMEDEDMLQY